MAKGFIRGVLWGAGISFGAVTLVSVLDDGPRATIDAQHSDGDAAREPAQTKGSAGNRIALTGAEVPMGNAPAPDTLIDLGADALVPAAVPETGLVGALAQTDLPSTTPTQGLGDTNTRAPSVTTTSVRGLSTPATEPDVSISTEPAQPPIPAVDSQQTAFAEAEEPSAPDAAGQELETETTDLSPVVVTSIEEPTPPPTSVPAQGDGLLAEAKDTESIPSQAEALTEAQSDATDPVAGSGQLNEQVPVLMSDAPSVVAPVDPSSRNDPTLATTSSVEAIDERPEVLAEGARDVDPVELGPRETATGPVGASDTAPVVMAEAPTAVEPSETVTGQEPPALTTQPTRGDPVQAALEPSTPTPEKPLATRTEPLVPQIAPSTPEEIAAPEAEEDTLKPKRIVVETVARVKQPEPLETAEAPQPKPVTEVLAALSNPFAVVDPELVVPSQAKAPAVGRTGDLNQPSLADLAQPAGESASARVSVLQRLGNETIEPLAPPSRVSVVLAGREPSAPVPLPLPVNLQVAQPDAAARADVTSAVPPRREAASVEGAVTDEADADNGSIIDVSPADQQSRQAVALPKTSAEAEAPQQVAEVRVNRLPTVGAETPTPVVQVAPESDEEVEPEQETPVSVAAGAGSTPFEQFAQPFENVDGKPVMSIILIDDGVDLSSETLGLPVLRQMPYPVTFAVDTGLMDAAERMSAYRQEGFEVLAMVNLPDGATATDAEVNLSVALERMPEVVGILDGVGTGVQTTRDSGRQVADILAQTGHGFVTQNQGLNTVQKLAARQGVPSAVVFRDFDSQNQSARVIRRFLDQAAFRAGIEGGVVMQGRLREETLSALLVWALQDRASQVAMAPVTAALRQRTP